jgi:NTP pyrophosphatase (non-canonical NTP hydrolase)
MKFKEYATIIEQTAVYPKSVDNFDLAYCYLGIMGESYELVKATERYDIVNMKKEAGDVIWYTTALANFYNLNIEELFVRKDESDEDLDLFMSFPELIKKYYRDNKDIPIDTIKTIITIIWNSTIEEFTDEEVSEILQTNYDKLLKRKKDGVLKGDGDNR